ncbi:hypothetical protein GL218_00834 [Daldinia childiae]|uniref:uncharacterized protein n=1 Tax=Daldinia childiae TaxID=326645 RepID=UPI001445D809|nr:uncharacterized protein GL218_00834 [Daldinia childiae]KAF3070369.1 hypothetical protein GL218_00834 [Daldinia childiae]
MSQTVKSLMDGRPTRRSCRPAHHLNDHPPGLPRNPHPSLSPYHYSEGPRSNLPFNTKTRFFALRYWGYMFTGFFAPVGIAVWQTKKPKA